MADAPITPSKDSEDAREAIRRRIAEKAKTAETADTTPGQAEPIATSRAARPANPPAANAKAPTPKTPAPTTAPRSKEAAKSPNKAGTPTAKSKAKSYGPRGEYLGAVLAIVRFLLSLHQPMALSLSLGLGVLYVAIFSGALALPDFAQQGRLGELCHAAFEAPETQPWVAAGLVLLVAVSWIGNAGAAAISALRQLRAAPPAQGYAKLPSQISVSSRSLTSEGEITGFLADAGFAKCRVRPQAKGFVGWGRRGSPRRLYAALAQLGWAVAATLFALSLGVRGVLDFQLREGQSLTVPAGSPTALLAMPWEVDSLGWADLSKIRDRANSLKAPTSPAEALALEAALDDYRAALTQRRAEIAADSASIHYQEGDPASTLRALGRWPAWEEDATLVLLAKSLPVTGRWLADAASDIASQAWASGEAKRGRDAAREAWIKSLLPAWGPADLLSPFAAHEPSKAAPAADSEAFTAWTEALSLDLWTCTQSQAWLFDLELALAGSAMAAASGNLPADSPGVTTTDMALVQVMGIEAPRGYVQLPGTSSDAGACPLSPWLDVHLIQNRVCRLVSDSAAIAWVERPHSDFGLTPPTSAVATLEIDGETQYVATGRIFLAGQRLFRLTLEDPRLELRVDDQSFALPPGHVLRLPGLPPFRLRGAIATKTQTAEGNLVREAQVLMDGVAAAPLPLRASVPSDVAGKNVTAEIRGQIRAIGLPLPPMIPFGVSLAVGILFLWLWALSSRAELRFAVLPVAGSAELRFDLRCDGGAAKHRAVLAKLEATAQGK